MTTFFLFKYLFTYVQAGEKNYVIKYTESIVYYSTCIYRWKIISNYKVGMSYSNLKMRKKERESERASKKTSFLSGSS